MRVRIVCYEEVDGWILGKFAKKLRDELTSLGVQAEIANSPDPAADINHHVIYLDYKGKSPGIDTVMVTHVDMVGKLLLLKKQLEEGAVGICMSSDTVSKLAAGGVPGDKLCYVLPAHDGLMVPRPQVVGITTRVYDDGRKREGMVARLAGRISPAEFSFRIMGDGWQEIVATLREKGFTVDYTPDFDIDLYRQMVPALDYYLYLGQDEGSMGFIDALAVGVPTIVTPQGYHVDAPGGLSYSFDTDAELFAVFEQIAEKKRGLRRSVASWTWSDYAAKHLEIWEYLLAGRLPDTFRYQDGVASLVGAGLTAMPLKKRVTSALRLLQGTLRCRLTRFDSSRSR